MVSPKTLLQTGIERGGQYTKYTAAWGILRSAEGSSIGFPYMTVFAAVMQLWVVF